MKKRVVLFSLFISAIAGTLVVGMGVPRAQERKGDDVLVQQTNQKGDNEKIPESWRGTWKVTVAYRDHETGALVSTDVTTAEMCPGEPIIPDLAINSLNCSANANVNLIGALCSAKHSPFPGCNVFVDTDLDSKRTGDIWSGTGRWTAKVVGNCEHIGFGEDFEVSGTRVSSNAACSGVRSSLVQRFFPHPGLIGFFAEENSHDKK